MPPDEAHTPMEMTHFGSAIWSYTVRTTGAILWLTRPETIIRSAWRGEARKTSMPKRAMSNRGVPAAIISIAQQARPIVTGHIEDERTQPTRSSILPSTKPEGSFSSSPMFVVPFSVPVQSAAPPFVDEGHGDEEQERHHGDESEDGQFGERHSPRVEEDDLDVEQDERHRDEVVLDRESPGGGARRGLDAALVGGHLDLVVELGSDDRRGGQAAAG